MDKRMSKKKENQVLDQAIEEMMSHSEGNVDAEQTRLLRKMLERQDRDSTLARIIAFAEIGLLIVLIIVFAFLVPRFLNTVRKVNATMESVDELVDQAKESLSEVTDLAVDADKVIEANEEAVKEAIKNFNSVDFESLNNSISGLAEVIQPIVDVVKILKE